MKNHDTVYAMEKVARVEMEIKMTITQWQDKTMYEGRRERKFKCEITKLQKKVAKTANECHRIKKTWAFKNIVWLKDSNVQWEFQYKIQNKYKRKLYRSIQIPENHVVEVSQKNQ